MSFGIEPQGGVVEFTAPREGTFEVPVIEFLSILSDDALMEMVEQSLSLLSERFNVSVENLVTALASLVVEAVIQADVEERRN